MAIPEDDNIENDPNFVLADDTPLTLLMGYTVQRKALESPRGLFNILLVTYEYKQLPSKNAAIETWYPFMTDVRIEVPNRATDEEISAIIAKDMIVREKNLHGVYPDDEEPGEEKEIDSPFGYTGTRISGEE